MTFFLLDQKLNFVLAMSTLESVLNSTSHNAPPHTNMDTLDCNTHMPRPLSCSQSPDCWLETPGLNHLYTHDISILTAPSLCEVFVQLCVCTWCTKPSIHVCCFCIFALILDTLFEHHLTQCLFLVFQFCLVFWFCLILPVVLNKHSLCKCHRLCHLTMPKCFGIRKK